MMKKLCMKEQKKKIVKKNGSTGHLQKDFYKKLIIEGNCVSTSASVVKKKFLIRKKHLVF